MTKKIKQIRHISTWSWSPSHSHLMGASGTDSAELEIHKWNNTSFKLKLNARLTTLAWGSDNVLAGGSQNGNLELYNISNTQQEAHVVFKTTRMVKALDFSRIDPNHLASVGNQNDFHIWELDQPGPTMTALKSTKMIDISNVSWNSQVQHIIAACANNGYTVVWDLRTKREILCLYAPESNISSIAWHPNMGTQIMTASRNNQNPLLSLWDLRSAHSPEKTLTGHSQGILDISWCSQDPDRLISSDLDGRIHCYDPIQGDFLGELLHLPNPIDQVDFCPSNPDIFAARSSVLNMFSIQERQHHADPLAMKRPSSMIRRPHSVSFGFGGKVVRCHGTTKVHMSTINMDPELKLRIQQLNTLSTDRFLELHRHERDWGMLHKLNSENARQDMIDYIQRHYPVPRAITLPTIATPETQRTHDPAVDQEITQYVAVGDFEQAVHVCMAHERYADALMFSMCGDDGLLARTQQMYLEQKKSQKHGYLWLLKGVMHQDLARVVHEADAERDWPTLFVTLCTYATSDEFESLCDALGNRLEDKQHALLFYLASGNVARAGSLWLDFIDDDVQGLIERLTVFKRMSQRVEKEDDRMKSVYMDYVQMLVDYGQLDIAWKYIQWVSNRDWKQQVLYDRIYHASNSNRLTETITIPEFPFKKISLQAWKPSSNTTTTTMRYYSAHQQPFV